MCAFVATLDGGLNIAYCIILIKKKNDTVLKSNSVWAASAVLCCIVSDLRMSTKPSL